jgi:thioredoxin 1
MRGKSWIGLFLIAAFFLGLVADAWADPGRATQVPVKGVVTMLDLGAETCLACKKMETIVQKLEKVYEGKVAIVYIDVWKDTDQAERFGVTAVPAQIFFDKEGQEVYRNVGLMSEEDIVKQLKKMGVD